MTFTWTTIHVRDLDQSLAFYHDLLGLPIQERFGPPGHEIAMLGPEEGTRLELIGGGEIPEHPAFFPEPLTSCTKITFMFSHPFCISCASSVISRRSFAS